MTAVVLASFDSEGAFLRARTRLIAGERRIVGEWLPYASEALGEGEGTRHIRLATILAGVGGAIGLFALETWSAVWAYPFDSGARSLFSWPAFIPAPVEFGALTGAIGGLAALFVRARLTRLHAPAFAFEEMRRASQADFVIAVACDAGAPANAVVALLAEVGAAHSRVVTA